MTKTTTAAIATLSKVKSSTNINKKYDPCQAKPYNCYNIFYILERERFLQSNSNYKRKTILPPSDFLTGYELLDMPALPPRYKNLDLPIDWYMPGTRKAKKRDHTKSHGLASFKDIARHVADEYRNIDKVTLEYVTTVAEILKQRQGELKAARRRELERLAEKDALASTSSIPTRSSSITKRVDACWHKKTKPAIEQYSTSAQSLPFVCELSVPSLPKLSISDLSAKTTTAAIATLSKVKSSTNINKKYDPCQTKPYNRYNIYYILERERFLQSNSNYKRKTVPPPIDFFTGYELLDMPALPPRYKNLDLPIDWYMPGTRKAKKRDHTKSHGLASFKDIARHVADEYRNIDKVTLEYVTTVAEILKQRQGELKAARRRELERLAEKDALASTSSIPTRSSSITKRANTCWHKKTKPAIEQYSTSAQSLPFVCELSVPSLPKLSISDLSARSASAVNLKAAARFLSSTSSGVRILNGCVNASQVSPTQRKVY